MTFRSRCRLRNKKTAERSCSLTGGRDAAGNGLKNGSILFEDRFYETKKATALAVAAFCLTLWHLSGNAASANPFNFSVIAGQWARVDGSYTLRVQNVMSDGTGDVSYFNPGRIHVAESRLSTQEGRIKLFVKLQDEGYPGCSYTLFYYHEQDVLAGVYYQAAVGQTYEVIFLRKKTR